MTKRGNPTSLRPLEGISLYGPHHYYRSVHPSPAFSLFHFGFCSLQSYNSRTDILTSPTDAPFKHPTKPLENNKIVYDPNLLTSRISSQAHILTRAYSDAMADWHMGLHHRRMFARARTPPKTYSPEMNEWHMRMVSQSRIRMRAYSQAMVEWHMHSYQMRRYLHPPGPPIYDFPTADTDESGSYAYPSPPPPSLSDGSASSVVAVMDEGEGGELMEEDEEGYFADDEWEDGADGEMEGYEKVEVRVEVRQYSFWVQSPEESEDEDAERLMKRIRERDMSDDEEEDAEPPMKRIRERDSSSTEEEDMEWQIRGIWDRDGGESEDTEEEERPRGRRRERGNLSSRQARAEERAEEKQLREGGPWESGDEDEDDVGKIRIRVISGRKRMI